MDPQDPLLPTPESPARETAGPSIGSIGPPVWPLARPARGALAFLEQALTAGVPKPFYDGPVRRTIMFDGAWAMDQAFTLPLEPPSRTAPHAPHLDSMWGYVKIPNPEPGLEPCSHGDITGKTTADDAQGARASAPGANLSHRDTAPVQSPPRGMFSRPRPRGILGKEGPGRARGDAAGREAQGGKAAAAEECQGSCACACRNYGFAGKRMSGDLAGAAAETSGP